MINYVQNRLEVQNQVLHIYSVLYLQIYTQTGRWPRPAEEKEQTITLRMAH